MTKSFEENKNEREAEALKVYFENCGLTAKRKGLSVKVTGEERIIDYLYNKFVFGVLLST